MGVEVAVAVAVGGLVGAVVDPYGFPPSVAGNFDVNGYSVGDLLVRNYDPAGAPTAANVRPLRLLLRYTLRSSVE